jgi:MFS family permease
MLVPLLFFCSGATALVYEVVWSKYLTLMFGSTVQAQTVVLAVFMGGLALGNWLFGRQGDRSPRPLAMYGYIEAAIGLYAFFFNGIYNAGDAIFIRLGTGNLDRGWWLLLLKIGLSVGLLLGPTILMGATLPVLASWLQRSGADAGRRAARFYSINSLGAVVGSGLAGFYLVRAWGMVSALQITALINVLVGVIALALSRRQDQIHSGAASARAASDGSQEDSPALRWRILLVAATGAVSMGMEVLASRSLALIFGSSLQAFAIVLMAFILGIGIGSAIVSSPRFKKWKDEIVLLVLLLGGAATVGVGARFLLRFDERTWQADLAPQEKRATLAALDEASVVSAFSQSSINQELMRSLESRLSRGPMSSELNDLPSVFHLPDPVWPAMLSDDADENLRQLVKADAALVAASTKWREAVETIKEILQAQTRPPLNWGSRTPEHFAAAAARACFRHGEFDEARKLVAIGAVSRPDDVEPAYLSRVLERAPSAGSK